MSRVGNRATRGTRGTAAQATRTAILQSVPCPCPHDTSAFTPGDAGGNAAPRSYAPTIPEIQSAGGTPRSYYAGANHGPKSYGPASDYGRFQYIENENAGTKRSLNFKKVSLQMPQSSGF